jgi:hypothetical protein
MSDFTTSELLRLVKRASEGRWDLAGHELDKYVTRHAAHIARLLQAYEAVEVGARMGLQIRGPNHFMRNALAALSALRGGVERVEGFEQ